MKNIRELNCILLIGVTVLTMKVEGGAGYPYWTYLILGLPWRPKPRRLRCPTK